MMGYYELSEYYEYSEMALDAIKPVDEEMRKWCKQKGYNPDDEDSVSSWVYEEGEKYSSELEEYYKYQNLASESIYKAYYDDFNSSDKQLEKALENINQIHMAIWSALIAMFIGLFLGIGEGVYYGSASNTVKYGLIGAGISIAIGAVSGYIAQTMYASMLSEGTTDVFAALIRGFGWAIMGSGIGAAVGLIQPGGKRIGFCILGGCVGAFTGGFLFNYIMNIGPDDMVARGVAIVIMGLLIGVGVGLLEQFAKSAWLKVIRGEFEGKEYLVFTGTTSIGNSGKNTIVLFKDKLIAPNHCDIVQEGPQYVLVDKGTPMGTVVNGIRVNRHVLRQGDAIAIGNTVLVFNLK